MRSVGVIHLGLCRYRQAIALQEVLAEGIRQRKYQNLNGILILVEHPPVFTVGIRKQALTQKDVERLKTLGADVEYVGRGGLVTFHGPGQLVAWPILDLKAFFKIKEHVHNLEESVIEMCKALDLNDVTRNKAYPGVWRGDAKLCAVGVRASRFVTTHGLAINICTDLTWFNHIVPCGIQDKKVTSLSEETKQSLSIEKVTPVFLDCFSKVFSCSLIDVPQQFKKVVASQ